MEVRGFFPPAAGDPIGSCCISTKPPSIVMNYHCLAPRTQDVSFSSTTAAIPRLMGSLF